MTNFIPVFPLKIVVFPGEKLNLHIFEPRYKQMVKECIAQKKGFGLPPVIDGQQQEFGTYLEILEMVTEHPDGSMDIRTQGVQVFRTLTMIEEVPDKLFSGAIVSYPSNVLEFSDNRMAPLIVKEVRRLYELLNVSERFPAEKESMVSYEIAHYVGFSLAQEYEMLGLFTELQRLEYIRRHLNNIVHVINELESMKERIQRNGHFRDLSLG